LILNVMFKFLFTSSEYSWQESVLDNLAIFFVILTVFFLAFLFVSENSMHQDTEKLEDIPVSKYAIFLKLAPNAPAERSKELPNVVEMSGDTPPVRSDQHALAGFAITCFVLCFNVVRQLSPNFYLSFG